MSYGIFLLRFADGEVVALDTERFRQVTAPYVVAGGLYHQTHGEIGMPCVTATHFARGAMFGVLARLAAALGAAIVPQAGDTLIFEEEERQHLPPELQGQVVVIVPTADVLQAAFDTR